jgi:rare lipoprotein A
MARLAHALAAPVLLALLLPGCAGNRPRPSPPVAETPRATHAQTQAAPRDTRSDFARACAPTRVHDERDYTPGGLYAPGVADTAPDRPIDVSGVVEPEPRAEPRSRYGNRSPYTVLGKTYHVLDDEDAGEYHERGLASWYGTKFNGRATSSGEPYDICSFTAAHKTLPLPSYVRVTNLDNGRSLIVRVNDRGPFHDGRVMDLSYAAAVRLGVDRTGTARVELEAVGPGAEMARSREPAPATAPARGNVIAATDPELLAGAPVEQLPPPTPSIAGEDVTLQVGSFAERDNARRLADRLRDAGVDAVDIDHVDVDGRDLWRVRIGPVAGADLAALRERLHALELPEPRVVRD